ncbi:uroporphyrinogen decarboxylase, partial [Pelagibacteraceae bacterium]|nr:uroporphyrinogen decarboxylase [Pelagibacteraceae bacterium]
MSELFKKSLSKENPLWLMRQAGRYLPEYQKVRKKQKNFINFCLDVNAATKVTLQPIQRYDLDAAIIFSDILVIPYALGQQVDFKKNEGPILGDFKLSTFKKTQEKEFIKKLKNVYLAIKKTRKLLNKKKSLIGFAGSPWTILVYVLNKKSPKKSQVYKEILKNTKQTKELLKIIEKFIYIHIEQQIKAGADTIQLFDSWAGLLEKKHHDFFCFQPTKRIIKKIKKKYPRVPIICFPKGIGKKVVDFCNVVKPDG